MASMKSGSRLEIFNSAKNSVLSSPSVGAIHQHLEKLQLYVEPSDIGSLHIFSGNANRELAAEIASKLGMQCGRATVKKFADGETNVVIHDSVRGNDIFIIQPISPPVNEHLMELIFMISALRRASAKTITAVIPYFGYSRQSKMRGVGETLGAADVALLLETVGVDRVISIDLHEGQIEGFFPPYIPVENLEPYLAAVPYFALKNLRDPVIVAPSAQGVARATKFRDNLFKSSGVYARMAMVVAKTKRVVSDSKSRVQRHYEDDTLIVIGELGATSDVIVVDDIIDTGSRAVRVAEALRNHESGCGDIYMFASHGIFTGDALQRLQDSPIREVVVTNTVPVKEYHPKIRHLSIAGILAECVRRIHAKESVSDLYSQF